MNAQLSGAFDDEHGTLSGALSRYSRAYCMRAALLRVPSCVRAAPVCVCLLGPQQGTQRPELRYASAPR